MTASFEKIDYSLRPAKYAERRMLRDIFRRLSIFDQPENYNYVGFGSVWFSDFILFHRALGVRNMVSIEKAVGARARIEDNLPFRIALDFRHSNTALTKLDWNPRQFVWLDYDDALRPEMFKDIRTVVARARSGSLLAVTVQCNQAREVNQAETDGPGGPAAIDRFREFFSRSQIPEETFDDDLVGRPFAALSRRMLLAEIEAAVSIRAPRSGPDMIQFEPICSFEYADDALMTTVVGAFYSHAERLKLQECDFSSLDFIKNREEVVDIQVPKLTFREMRVLEAQLPDLQGVGVELGSIPAGEAQRFIDFYRYLPTFAVLEN
jgi:hypothetical protein